MDRQRVHAAPKPMHLKIRNADDDTAPPRPGSFLIRSARDGPMQGTAHSVIIPNGNSYYPKWKLRSD
jgi:hypothetical protein